MNDLPDPRVKLAEGLPYLTDFRSMPIDQQVWVLEKAGIDVRQIAMNVFDAAITEETTDVAITVLAEAIKAALPGWLSWLPIRRQLDGLFPNKLREIMIHILWGGLLRGGGRSGR